MPYCFLLQNKMKKYITLIFILSFIVVQSQDLSVVYQEKRVLTPEKLERMPEEFREIALRESKIKHLYTLVYSDGLSMYKNNIETKNLNEESSTITKNEEERKIIEDRIRVTNSKYEKYYYKNFKEGLMLFNFTNANKNFDGKDKLLEWNWQITNEVKVIDNYNCRKAVSTAFGYDFTAWFTEEIPVNAGPEKFDGLPGLILFVQTAGIEYSVVSIKTEKKLDVIKPKIVANTFTMS